MKVRVHNHETGLYDFFELREDADLFIGKDSNGEDIFEGDTVQVMRKDSDGKRTIPFRGVVKMSAGKGAYMVSEDKRVHSLYLRYCTLWTTKNQHNKALLTPIAQNKPM